MKPACTCPVKPSTARYVPVGFRHLFGCPAGGRKEGVNLRNRLMAYGLVASDADCALGALGLDDLDAVAARINAALVASGFTSNMASARSLTRIALAALFDEGGESA